MARPTCRVGGVGAGLMGAIIAMLVLAQPAQAGFRTKLMFPFDIGGARSLLRQIADHYNPPLTALSAQVRGLVGLVDGYDLVRKGLALRPIDPAFEFGAALIAGVNHLGGAAFEAHARRAEAMASQDTLVARNLDRLSRNREP